jgi:hypothetical protein
VRICRFRKDAIRNRDVASGVGDGNVLILVPLGSHVVDYGIGTARIIAKGRSAFSPRPLRGTRILLSYPEVTYSYIIRESNYHIASEGAG